MLSFKPAFSLSSFIPRWHSDKEFACQCRRHGFNPWVGKIPCRKKWEPTSVFLSGKLHGQSRLAGCSPCGVADSDMTENTHVHIFTLIKRFFSSASLSSIKGGIICKSELVHISPRFSPFLIPACDSSSPAFYMMYSA